jgi:hypothetical protein
VQDFERRHQRSEDAPLIEVVRAVQQFHDSAIAKLVDSNSQLVVATAVQATTLATLATVQAQHVAMLRENDRDHSYFRGTLRVVVWGIPILVSVAALIISAFHPFALASPVVR